jgi:glycosyltransferase involved in cell wall biosynthesis
MPSACIGVHIHAQPDRLHATLAALCEHTPAWARLLLLPDGPDTATAAALAGLADLPQIGTREPCGAAACFNRLAAASDEDVIVLLESGALVAPGWLDRLLDALAADSRNGLAGPSTNRAWNEQAAFPGVADDPAAIARAAREAAMRYAGTARTLEPLHSLADFCYAVTRAVVQAVGAADEGYGLGPCWEMDYNIRAARAGFRGVWAGAAYVHRAPPTPRHLAEESRRLAANRRRYQDKFCALRLSGRRADYEPHCRGESCEHFAPAGQIQLFIPLPLAGDGQCSPGAAQREPASAPPRVPPSGQVARVTRAAPLVSCIVPTRDRPDYLLQSLRYFQRQDYPELELVIVDDGAPGLARILPDDPRIRYEHVGERQSIGAKRNRACALARGEYIAHWDDDDWYAPRRLSAQIAPLLAGEADISALVTGRFFDLDRWAFWRCTPELHRRMFVEDVHGGTLVYRRRLWEQSARYPDRSLAEDAAFLRQALRYGARLRRLSGDDLFVYLRHIRNSWSFECGEYLDPAGWRRDAEPPFTPGDRAFYAARSGVSAERWAPDAPLVSCIMPTAGRRAFVPLAIGYFLRQDYPNRELVVVDDGADPVEDLVPGDPRIRYVRLEQRTVLGEKRNIACRLARGAIICHWDDDDWMAPQRLSYQLTALLRSETAACGAAAQLYYDPAAGHAWLYRYPGIDGRWVAGNTLCYRRELWQRAPFAPVAVGEDTRFVWGVPRGGLKVLPDYRFYVGLIHPGNTGPKRVSGSCWHRRPVGEVAALLGADIDSYRRLGDPRAGSSTPA